MMRTRLFTRNFLKITLAVAMVAVSVLVINLIQPGDRPVQLAAADEIRPVPAFNRAQKAEAARLEAMADNDNLQRARQVEVARWEAIADYFSASSIDLKLNKAQQAEAARLEAMADYISMASTSAVLNRAQLAEVARLNGLANDYFLKNGTLSPARLAEAARLTAIAFYYNVTPDQISYQLHLLLGK